MPGMDGLEDYGTILWPQQEFARQPPDSLRHRESIINGRRRAYR